jgi:hypothetical protein
VLLATLFLLPLLSVIGSQGVPTALRAPSLDAQVAGYEGTLYTGQLHNHASSYGDDGLNTASQNMNYMLGTATPPLKFGGLAPHAHMLTSPNMLTYWSEMRASNSPTYAAVPGQEWSSLSTSGHTNVFLAADRCTVANGDIPGFYAWLNTSGGYGSFNHPWDTGGSSMNNWQYYPALDKPGNFDGKMVMMEMKQGSGDSTAFSSYISALNNGWHIGISVSDDDHLGVPGNKYANKPRTGMWLTGLTEAAVETAFQDLRFFGTQMDGGFIDLKAGNYTMGDVFMGSNGTTLTAMLNSSFTYAAVEIFIDGISYPMTQIDSGHYSYTIQAGAKHYYFVRAREWITNAYIISSPMWSGVGGSTPPPEPPPITSSASPTNVTAELSGANVNVKWTQCLNETPTNGQVQIVPTDDSQVVEGYPSTNYGAATSLYVQSDSLSLYLDERAWMRYSLGAIPAGATITSAQMKMYCWKALGSNMDAVCHPSADDTWLETGINWGNQPAYGAALDTKTLAVGVTSVWYSWDVTSFIQAEWAGNKLASLLVKPSIEGSSPAKTYTFESSEYATTTLRPYLQVNYTTVSGTGRYEIYRANAYNPLRTGYAYVGQVPAGSSSYSDVGAGIGDASNHYYYVRAVNASGGIGNSTTQGGKFVKAAQAGWNLVSTPLIPASSAMPGLLGSDAYWDRAMFYDAADAANRWKQYNKAWPASFNDLGSWDQKKALWLNFTTAGNMVTAGQVPGNTTMTLRAGWNFIGYPAKDDGTFTVGQFRVQSGAMIVEGFNAAATYKMSQLSDGTVMKRGDGYWVCCSTDVAWTVNW